MDSSALKVSYSVDYKNRMKLKKDALEYVDLLQEYLKDPKYKTELCKTYEEKKFCVYGNKCRFAHGKQELFQKAVNHPKYKIKKCISFYQHSFCSYGPNCHFKHNEKKINQTNRTYYTFLLNLLGLNVKEKVGNQGIKFFDEDDSFEFDSLKSHHSFNSSETEKTSFISSELIEEKLRQKLKRLPVFSKISQDQFNVKEQRQ